MATELGALIVPAPPKGEPLYAAPAGVKTDTVLPPWLLMTSNHPQRERRSGPRVLQRAASRAKRLDGRREWRPQVASEATYTVTPNSVLDARVAFKWNESGKVPYHHAFASINNRFYLTPLLTNPYLNASLGAQARSRWKRFSSAAISSAFQRVQRTKGA